MNQQERRIDQDFKIDYNSLAPLMMFAVFLYGQGGDPKVVKAAFLALVWGVFMMIVRYALARRSLGPRENSI